MINEYSILAVSLKYICIGINERPMPGKLTIILVLISIISSCLIIGVADTDNDGLNNYKEGVLFETNWTNEDSDGDGVKDGKELSLDIDPTYKDSDWDGVKDGKELSLDIDPTNEDSDGDGAKDGKEVHVLKTDPANPNPNLQHPVLGVILQHQDSFADQFYQYYLSDQISKNEDKFFQYYINLPSLSSKSVSVINNNFLSDGDISKEDLYYMKILSESSEEWFDYRTDNNLPIDADKDGIMIYDDSQPFSPNNQDKDPLLDGWYNADMDSEFDEDEIHGESTLDSASKEEADIIFYYFSMKNPDKNPQKPTDKTFQKVQNIFRNAPIENLNGKSGYNITWINGGKIEYRSTTSRSDVRGLVDRVPKSYQRITTISVFVFNGIDYGDGTVGGVAFYPGNTKGAGSGVLVAGTSGETVVHEFTHTHSVSHAEMTWDEGFLNKSGWNKVVTGYNTTDYYEHPE